MRKMRKFEIGGMTSDDDALEAKYKAAGLAASNAENKKSSGFFGRLGEGNIDQKGSEAYNKYGAGYGRKLEADKAAKSEDDPEAKFYGASKAQPTAPAASIPTDKSDNSYADLEKKRFASPAKESSTATRVVEDMPKTRPAGGAQVEAGDARVAEYANKFPSSTTSGKGDRGARDTSSFKKAATKPPAAETKMERRNLSVPNAAGPSAPASAAAKAPEAAAEAPEAAAKAPEAAKPAEKPLSPAQQKAKDAIARATGNLASSQAPTPEEAERNRASFAEKAGDAVSSVGNFFSELDSTGKRRSRLAKEAKDKEKASFNRERGDRAGGGAIRGYASGGSVSASSRGDGIAQRGKTRGKMC